MVIALGGNALIKKGQMGTIYEQFENTRESLTSVVKIIKHGWDVALTHGNGPQVGAILLQNDAAKEVTPPMPLGVCVAQSEGLIGYMIQQNLHNMLKREGVHRSVIALITQVIVDADDPALQDATKPVGPYYDEQTAHQMQKEGYVMQKRSGGWRIMVPSPDPRYIVDGKLMKQLMDQGVIVIAAGGGGMPVIQKPGWGLDGVEAVIDKDLASEHLAEAVNAEVLMILTNVEKVYLKYTTPEQQPLNRVTVSEIERFYEEGHFPEGSMGPKILAAIRFLKAGGKKVVISDIAQGWNAFNGKTGTVITPD